MKILGLDLDNSPEVAENKSLRYAENITIDNKFSSYFNDPGFFAKLNIDSKFSICGTISTNVGFVLFCVINNPDNNSKNSVILYYDCSNNNVELKKEIHGNFGFNLNNPITGDYIYNYNGDLIVVFTEGLNSNNETRIININNPLYEDSNTQLVQYIENNNLALFNLAPDMPLPTINVTVGNGGHLKTGAYQVALSYKLPDGTYTNYTTLTPTAIIAGNYPDDNALGIYVANNLTIKISNLAEIYNKFKLAIVYIDEESQTVYETEDITKNEIDGIHTYIINELLGLATISLDDLFIKNINYVKDKTLLNFHNRLYRGNTKTTNLFTETEKLKLIADKISVIVKYHDPKEFYNTHIPYFKTGEAYLLYAAFYNKKGDLLNIINIPSKESSNDLDSYTRVLKTGPNKDIYAHLIPDPNSGKNPSEDNTSSLFGEDVDVSPNDPVKPFTPTYKYNRLWRSSEYKNNNTFGLGDSAGYIQSDYILGEDMNIEYEDIDIPANEFLKAELLGTYNNPTVFTAKAIKIKNSTGDAVTYNIDLTLSGYAESAIPGQPQQLRKSNYDAYITIFWRYSSTGATYGYPMAKKISYPTSNVLPLSITESFEIPDGPIKTDLYIIPFVSIVCDYELPSKPELGMAGEYPLTINVIECKITPSNYIKNTTKSNNNSTINNIKLSTKSITFGDDNINKNNSEFCATLHPIVPVDYIKSLSEEITSISFLYAEHNELNSRILSQAILFRDTETNSFSNNQNYDKPFRSSSKARLYTFDFLFNKNPIIKFIPTIKYASRELLFKPIHNKLDKPINVIRTKNHGNNSDDYKDKQRPIDIYDGNGKDTLSQTTNLNIYKSNIWLIDTDGTELLFTSIDSLKNYTRYNYKIEQEYLAEYIHLNNSAQDNTAGDSFYRISNANNIRPIIDIRKKDINAGDHTEDTYYNRYMIIMDLLNPSEILYSSKYNQKLQIASPIYQIDKLNTLNDIKLQGDTYISTLALRATTPKLGYLYGDNNNKDLDSNSYVYRYVFSVPIESKYNIAARFSKSAADKSFKPTKESDLYDYFKVQYKIDNFINTDEGKGYSKIYNENGIEKFTYFENIEESQNHPYRVIRSQEITSESLALNWRIFKTNDYKDMPFNRGEIISLKGDSKSIYIQQKYGLQLLQLKDTINNNEENTSYLGTADIFNLDPQEIMFSPTGYIGCEHQFDTTINANGYYVIDSVHKKIFHVAGSKIAEISNLNTAKWFKNNLKVIDNNPYINRGRYFVFNELTNLLYLVQQNDFTLSLSPIINKWISFHTYKPTMGLYNRNGMFWINNKTVYFVENTIRNFYLNGRPDPSYIKFILNEYPQYNKLLNSIVWKDRIDNPYKIINKPNYFYKTIDEICVLNDGQCSNYKKVEFNDKWYDGSTGVNKINNWRFNNINDILKSEDDYVLDMVTDPRGLTVNSNNIKRNPKWYDVNKFISQFIYCIMKLNNYDGKIWELIDIEPQFVLDNRNKQVDDK